MVLWGGEGTLSDEVGHPRGREAGLPCPRALNCAAGWRRLPGLGCPTRPRWRSTTRAMRPELERLPRMRMRQR